MIKVNFDADGYVANWTKPPNDVENSIEYSGEVPPDFVENCRCYKLIDGRLALDENKQAAILEAKNGA